MKDIINLLKKNKVSVHYLILRDGRILRLVNDDRDAFHAGSGRLEYDPDIKNRLNEYSIGIELLAIGTQDEMKQWVSKKVYDSIPKENIGYTDPQYKSLDALLSNIYTQQHIIKSRRNIIGHSEYASGRKTDPGLLFDFSKIGF